MHFLIVLKQVILEKWSRASSLETLTEGIKHQIYISELVTSQIFFPRTQTLSDRLHVSFLSAAIVRVQSSHCNVKLTCALLSKHPWSVIDADLTQDGALILSIDLNDCISIDESSWIIAHVTALVFIHYVKIGQ